MSIIGIHIAVGGDDNPVTTPFTFQGGPRVAQAGELLLLTIVNRWGFVSTISGGLNWSLVKAVTDPWRLPPIEVNDGIDSAHGYTVSVYRAMPTATTTYDVIVDFAPLPIIYPYP